jgi:hypothetical protein
MSEPENDNLTNLRFLIRIGGIFALFQASAVIFAFLGYFIWPHEFTNAEKILVGINESPATYFMKLDPIVLIGTLLQFPVWIALWAALFKTDFANSTLGLVIGLISTVAVLTTRPIIELFLLSSQYESYTNLEQRQGIVTSAETLLSLFHGTSWAISVIFGGIAAIVFFFAMRKSLIFRKTTAWFFLLSGLGALFVLIPTIGIILLFFLATIGGILASIFVGTDLIRYSNAMNSKE